MRTFSRDSYSPAAGHAAATADRRRGSALLIVLGFLSFMIISAVSFAIYMRIERQASSNYRHSVTARHLLNAGLFRAIDEIDSELRIQKDSAGAGPIQSKFPDWPGRVKVSALPTKDLEVQKAQDTRVLSIESLSYLPAFLINDVRRYAVRDEDIDKEWMGAKWRTLERSTDNDIVGRYAYVCVNISDMLDVNLCKANQARDSFTGRVNLGHLFGSDVKRDIFDDDFTKALHYFSLQDFYAVRYDRNQAADSSPYHDYLENGRLTVFGNAANLKHVFTTDSIVKPEPTNGTACNILLNPPFSEDLLKTMRPEPIALKFNETKSGERPFWNALSQTKNAVKDETLMAALLADYLDTDSIPKRMDMPSVEMTPMISQIVIDKLMKPRVFKKVTPAADKQPEKIEFGLQLIPDEFLNEKLNLSVEYVWPFKYFKDRVIEPFSMRGLLCFTIVNNKDGPLNTHDKQLMGSFNFELKSKDSGNLAKFSETLIYANLKACFQEYRLMFQLPISDDNRVLLIDSLGKKLGQFAPEDSISVACTFWIQITTKYNNLEYSVDQVPCQMTLPGVQDPEKDINLWRMGTPKLYFHTDEIKVSDLPTSDGKTLEYKYNSLEIPDPRFNYKAVNWLSQNTGNAVDKDLNKSTSDMLKDNTGRDADIFMSVSDAGMMQSPGELGYIIRPFKFNQIGTKVELLNQKTIDDINENTNPDKGVMFRTFRLYDHGGTGNDQLSDNVYDHFYAMKADGTLPGARVNPLSDIPEVLDAALFNTPLNYWLSATNNPLALNTRKDKTFNKDASHFNGNIESWEKFRKVWSDALIQAVTTDVKANGQTFKVNREWKSSLYDVYGKWQVFKWYSPDPTRMEIFGKTGLLVNRMEEIDRKMLYSFSLDSFSDRQQLFLYILRAEATVPLFGGGADSGMRSLAGGRAVALVWRDPYPRGYNKEKDLEGTEDDLWSRKTGKDGWYPNLNGFTSPWCQYFPNRDEKPARWDSYHDTRILFFKQLDK